MDLGVPEGRIVLKTDASAALGIAHRLGIGKIRHIEVNQIWLQEKVYAGEIIVEKVKTDKNLADALTKPLTNEDILKHIHGMGYEMRRDRHRLAPAVTAEEFVEEADGEDADEVNEDEHDQEQNDDNNVTISLMTTKC